MKIKKIIFLLTTIVFLTSVSYETKAANDPNDPLSIEDCSQVVKLHKKLICKMRGESTYSGAAKKEDPDKPEKKTSKHKEVKDKIEGDFKSLWKKIKNFGGENVGDEG